MTFCFYILTEKSHWLISIELIFQIGNCVHNVFSAHGQPLVVGEQEFWKQGGDKLYPRPLGYVLCLCFYVCSVRDRFHGRK